MFVYIYVVYGGEGKWLHLMMSKYLPVFSSLISLIGECSVLIALPKVNKKLGTWPTQDHCCPIPLRSRWDPTQGPHQC